MEKDDERLVGRTLFGGLFLDDMSLPWNDDTDGDRSCASNHHGVGGVRSASFALYAAFGSLLLSTVTFFVTLSSSNDRLQGQVDSMSRILDVIVPALISNPQANETSNDSSSPYRKAVVLVERANLRELPDKNSALVMSVGRGSELLISETAENWHRTFTPTGASAWISSDLVRLE